MVTPPLRLLFLPVGQGDPLYPFHHDDLVTILIHEVDIFLAEVSSIKDETNLTVSILLCLLQHLLEQRDIDNASWILLIVKRL